MVSNWRQLLGGRLKYVLSVESTCTRASLHSDQNIISRWVSLNATKMNYQTIFAFKFFGIGTNPQVRGMQRFSTVRETKLAALSRFSQVQKPSFSSINSTHQSLLYYPLNVLSVPCTLLTPFMRQMSSKGGAETKRKAAMAKMPKTYIKYNKFRDKWMKRAAASRSFKTFKKVYSDKKAAENGTELTKMGIVERMKFFISHYGKVFIPLHYVFGTGVYFSTCYLAVYVGLDITPLLEQLPQNAKDFLHLDKVNEYKKTGIFIQVRKTH